MFEVLTGAGLAAAAGLNAYIPLLAIGLLSRFTDLVSLPPGWAWLENGWVQIILGVLLVIEIVADKVPAVDSVNDWIQTIVRPAAGGIAREIRGHHVPPAGGPGGASPPAAARRLPL